MKMSVRKTTLYVLFFLSGVSGLIYEVVWLRMLIRTLGSTTYAISIVLAAFMGGLAAGSYIIGRCAAKTKRHLEVYALLQLGVGISAVALTLLAGRLLPLYRIIYDLAGEDRFTLTLFQSGIMFVLLLVPTSLMGGTLPVLSAHTRTYGIGFASRIGVLYSVNTLGAVVGVLSSGIFLIGAWGETTTLGIGVAITLTVALVSYLLSIRPRSLPDAETASLSTRRTDETVTISAYPASTRTLVSIAYALSGLVAMAYEIVWTRMFQINVGTSVYAFSIMLAFYLLGIGAGSLWGSRLAERTKNPLRLFGLAQLGIASYSIIGIYIFTLFEPLSLSTNLDLGNVLLMPLVIICPVTFVLGLIFPAVYRIYVRNEEEVSRAVGRLYALNTLGCILGALFCGFVFISVLGTRGSMLFLAALNMMIGLTVLLRESPGTSEGRLLGLVVGGWVLTAALLGLFSPDPFKIAVKKAMDRCFGPAVKGVEMYYHKESVVATTTAFGIKGQPLQKHLWINGIGMTILCTETKLMAHLPLLLVENPTDMLVVCFGMGTTVRSARSHGTLKIDTVELVPETYECYKYFHADGEEVLGDPRVRYYVDDGRNFLLMRSKQYDVITMDPAPPIWSAGTVNLYTKEFFELCRQRLKPKGVMCLWIPPAASTEVLMIMKTFQTVFPTTYVWRGLSTPVAGFFLTGLKEGKELDVSRFRLVQEDRRVAADLGEWLPMKPTAQWMRSLLILNPDGLSEFVAEAAVITDDHPYTEFPLWRSIFDEEYGHLITVRPRK